MASTKNITMRQYNGTDYDTLYPKTKAEQILGAIPVTSGGTGATTATDAVDSLISALSTITPAAEDLIVLKDASGTAGNTTLTALATLMSSLGGGAKIQTGSYTGTGTYGSSNPCTLTFDFEPKCLIKIRRNKDNPGYDLDGSRTAYVVLLWGISSYYTTDSGLAYKNALTFNGNTISWYNLNGAADQENIIGSTYYYIVAG